MLYERSKEISNVQLVENQFKISSDSIDKSPDQKYLLRFFWKKMLEVEKSEKIGYQESSQQFENLVESLFLNADPITINRLFELFSFQSIPHAPSLDEDWCEYLVNRISRYPIFGYEGRMDSEPMQEISDDEDLAKLNEDYDKRSQEQYKESIKLGIKSRCLVISHKSEPYAQEYINKLKGSFKSEEFKNLIKRHNLTEEYIISYKKLIEDVEREVKHE